MNHWIYRMFISVLDFYFQFRMDVSTLSQSQICELNRFIFLSIRISFIQNLRSEIILSPGFHWKQLGKYRMNHWIYRMLCLSQYQISTFSLEWMFQHYLSLRLPLLFRNELNPKSQMVTHPSSNLVRSCLTSLQTDTDQNHYTTQ